MLRNWYRPGRATRGASASDTEALQTDVMRFMAIIGLCLTAVFSLMRSIADPAESSSGTTEIKALQQQLSLLQEQLAQQDLSAKQLEDELNSKQAQLIDAGKQQRELQHLQSRFNQILSDKDRDQLQLESALEHSRAKTSELLTQLQTESEQTESIDTVADNAPSNNYAEPPKQGFALKFASEETLSKLIRSNQVKLLAMAGHQAWQLRLHQGNPAFHKTSMPARYYEMLPTTLPAQYRRAFFVSSDRVNVTDLVWAVQIPTVMEQQIQNLLLTDSGGELIILSNGSVSLQAGGDE